MTEVTNAFKFEHIPRNIDKSSIKVFVNTKGIYSLEYGIVQPQDVFIHMHAVPHGLFRKQKSVDRGMAAIQQFATALGLHPDFHVFGYDYIPNLVDVLESKIKTNNNETLFYSGGLLGLPSKNASPISTVDGFTDNILEILTDNAKFAFVQFLFKPIDLPKEFRPEDDRDPRLPQIRYDFRHDKVQPRYSAPTVNIMEETGCFEFSPRIILAEDDPITLKSKLERLAVIFLSNGFKVRKYPSFFRRFPSFKSLLLDRKIRSPSILDGFSLMNFISPPSRQFSHEGYTLVPNKTDYLLSSGVHKTSTSNTINLGIPIISSATSGVPLLIDGKDLSRHMAVFGMTGEGKSRFIYGLVQELVHKGVKFLIFDPKGEYLRPIHTFCPDVLYLKPGSTPFPWGINIFQIPADESGEPFIPVEDHIQFVSSVLEHVFSDDTSVSPQMRRLLHLAIIQTVKNKGDFRSFIDLLKQPDSLGMTGSYLENTAAGVINRVEKLFFGNTGRCFTVSETTFEIAHLLDHNAIIDLSAFEAMEDQSGRQIFLNVVFQYLYYYVRMFREPFKEDSLPKNVFILDEIQKLIPVKNFRSKSPESMISGGPWTLRAYDISMFFIGTDPIVDQPMLTNTGVLTMFFTKYDPYVISNLLGISRTEYEQLRHLLKAKQDERRCIISINGQISLLKTNSFAFDTSSPFNLDELSSLPLQQELLDSYTRFYFDPIKEIFSNK